MPENVTFHASPEPATAAATYMTEAIKTKLQSGVPVVWLLSGGSAVSVAVSVARALIRADINLAGLSVSLTDERYGAPGHDNSNWEALLQAGFSLPGAQLMPVLSGGTLMETVADYSQVLDTLLQPGSWRLGLFGMGTDGHTAGILPHSPATEQTDNLAVGYEWTDYVRLTMTSAAILRLDEAVLFAAGPAKWPMLRALPQLKSTEEMPVQTLKQVKLVTVFTDNPEEAS